VAAKRTRLEKQRRAKWEAAERQMAPPPEMPPPDLGLTLKKKAAKLHVEIAFLTAEENAALEKLGEALKPRGLGLTYAVLNGVIEIIQKYGRR